MQKLAKMKASGRKFVYGYSVKEINPDLNKVYGYYQYTTPFPKGRSTTTNDEDEDVDVVGSFLSYGFHLTFYKKDLKMFIRQSFVFEDKRKICVIRVKVDIGDILAIGEHLGAGSFPTTPDHAFLAKVVTWDGRFNLKTAKGTISKKSLTLQE